MTVFVLAVKSRTLMWMKTETSSSSCGYHNALLNWLTGGFCQPTEQIDIRHVNNDDNSTEVDDSLSSREVHDNSGDAVIDIAVERPSAEKQSETWMIAASQSTIVSTKLNVTYSPTAEVISVLK